jgi:hypothetical protein
MLSDALNFKPFKALGFYCRIAILTHFYEFRKFIKISPVSIANKVKPFYSGRIASKLMAKHTSLLTKNTAFEHKFHVDMRKWQK